MHNASGKITKKTTMLFQIKFMGLSLSHFVQSLKKIKPETNLFFIFAILHDFLEKL